MHFPDSPGLRPTPDRIRETLFNWLQAAVRGARCLDLFAGSGALGLEALSRGARAVVFVEHAPEPARMLAAELARLAGPEAVWAMEYEYVGSLELMDPVVRSSMQAGDTGVLLEWLEERA